MNINHLYEYVNVLERVLSVGYKEKYATSYLENAISYSSFFQRLEGNTFDNAPISTDTRVIEELFPELKSSLEDEPIYNQCLWAAESYLRIQYATKLTFECIFLYMPISKMYGYFNLYHEMDFSQIVDEFKRLYSMTSVFSLALQKRGISLKQLSDITGISYDTLSSLKSRRRDISKVGVDVVSKLSKALHMRIETISELKM